MGISSAVTNSTCNWNGHQHSIHTHSEPLSLRQEAKDTNIRVFLGARQLMSLPSSLPHHPVIADSHQDNDYDWPALSR